MNHTEVTRDMAVGTDAKAPCVSSPTQSNGGTFDNVACDSRTLAASGTVAADGGTEFDESGLS